MSAPLPAALVVSSIVGPVLMVLWFGTAAASIVMSVVAFVEPDTPGALVTGTRAPS